jgi:hypothetical protein
MERLVEESKEEYYRVLKLCSQGWHEGKNEIIPWWNYFLSTLRSAAASPQLIRKVLAEMKRQGMVRLMGRGRSARWEGTGNHRI